MPDLLQIDAQGAPAFLPLTFPAFRNALLAAGHDTSIIAFGVVDGHEPIALGLAQLDGATAQVLSLFTVAAYRNRGLASALIRQLDSASRSAGAAALELRYMTGRASEAPLTRLLDKQGWAAPEPRMLFLRAHRRPLDQVPHWIRQPVAPKDMRVFAWRDLTRDAELRLRACHAAQPWVPPELDPFAPQPNDPPFDPDTSLGLQWGDDVAGWMITHRISQDTMRYSQWCIHPGLRRGAAGAYLLGEAIRRQLTTTDVPWLQLGVFTHNHVMLRFLERHLHPYFNERFYSVGRRKQLA